MLRKSVSLVLSVTLLLTVFFTCSAADQPVQVSETAAVSALQDVSAYLAGAMSSIPKDAWSRDINAGGYTDGAPIGGFGAGTITWRFDGQFYKGRLDIGSNNLDIDGSSFFYMYQKPQGQSAVFKKLTAASLGSGQAAYYSLFPKSWVDYYGSAFQCKARVTQFSPIIPGDYQRTSYPVGVYKWDLTNPTNTACEVGIMLSWNNNFGGSYAQVMVDGSKKGIVLKRGTQNASEETHGEFSLASMESGSVTVSYSSASNLTNLEQDFSSDGSLNNSVGQNNLGGICFKAVIQPGQSITVPIILSWDIPVAKAGTFGDKWYKRYTRFFGRSGLNSWNIANETLANYQAWENSIDTWQGEILNNNKYPGWLKTALFNELYYYFTGGTYWEAGAASGQPDNPDEDMFSHLETYDYQYYGTSDVRFYGSWPLLFYWPEIDKQCVRQFSDSVYNTRSDRPAAIGTTAHDFGTYDNVFRRWNAYTFRDTTKWKDLNAKLVLMIYRDWALTGKTDTALLNYCWNSINIAMNKVKSQDTDGDGIPNSEGVDQTYDNMSMKGNTSYNGGLVLAACEAAREIALKLGDSQKAAEYQNWFNTAKASFEAKLWTGTYYGIDTGSSNPERVLADQLCGQWYARACGLPDIVSNDHAVSALQKVVRNNFRSYYSSSAGVVNVAFPDGKVDTGSQQTQEVWTGVNWGLAALLVQYGMLDEAEDLGFSLYSTIYNAHELWFRTPEAWTEGGGKIRAPYYMRATAVWALKQAYDSYGVPQATNNAAAGKTVTASSIEKDYTPGMYACDGKLSTRWSSLASDPQWISVDLGENHNIDRVKVFWEAASAKAYKIQVSSDGAAWTDVYMTASGDGGIDNIAITPVNARYIRLYLLQRNTKWGYSLYELEVYGAASSNPPANNQKIVQVWFSSEKNPKDAAWYTAPMDFTYKLSRQPDLRIRQRDNTQMTTINVEPAVKYQTIYGMGSSIEESTVFNLSRMSPQKREEMLRKLVDPVNGIGMNFMRICFGSSDFTGRSWYSYDDMPAGQTDVSLSSFSIQKDYDYNIIQTIQQALAINPDLKILASPWSPPAWMKTSGNMCGGNLKREYFQVAAQYYRKAVKAYEAAGIPIWAFTIQNEPGANVTTYPTCGMSWQDERDFVKLVKNEFLSNSITTKVWILDHNFSMASDFAAPILQDAEAYAAADGAAFHDYVGNPSDMSALHNSFPEKEIFLTERSTWGTGGMHRIIEYFRNWACTYNAWVSMLDSSKKPNNGPYNPDPTLAIQHAANNDNYWLIPEYYMLGQFTKFVQRGARRIYSDLGSASSITNVAFLNPDNTIVVAAVNQTDSEQLVKLLVQNNGQITVAIPAKTVATYKWDADLPLNGLAVPGKIEGEMFSSMYSVDTQECSEGGLNVDWIGTGDWMDYKVSVSTAGKYVVEYRIASNDASGRIQLKSGAQVLADTAFTGTGGWQNWTTVADTVYLNAGEQTIRVFAAQNGFNLNWLRFSPATGAPSWFQNFETWGNFTSGAWSSISRDQSSANSGGVQCAKLQVTGYGDPYSYEKCVNATPQNGTSINAANQSFFVFFVKDTQGSNTVRVTFVDSDNQIWSSWTNVNPVKNQWSRASIPMNAVTGINKGAIKEIRLGEWNDGTYYFDDLYFSDSCSESIPQF